MGRHFQPEISTTFELENTNQKGKWAVSTKKWLKKTNFDWLNLFPIYRIYLQYMYAYFFGYIFGEINWFGTKEQL